MLSAPKRQCHAADVRQPAPADQAGRDVWVRAGGLTIRLPLPTFPIDANRNFEASELVAKNASQTDCASGYSSGGFRPAGRRCVSVRARQSSCYTQCCCGRRAGASGQCCMGGCGRRERSSRRRNAARVDVRTRTARQAAAAGKLLLWRPPVPSRCSNHEYLGWPLLQHLREGTTRGRARHCKGRDRRDRTTAATDVMQ